MTNWIRKAADSLIWRQNIYVKLAWSLFVLMVLYSVCRVAFYFYNREFFAGMEWSRFVRIAWGGLRFDLTAILYLNAVFVLLLIIPFRFRFNDGYQRAVSFLFMGVNALGLAANVMDTVYYRFTLRRTTLSVFRQFENEQNGWTLAFQFLMDYWYALVFWMLLVLAMRFLYKRIRVGTPYVGNHALFYGGGSITMVVIMGLVVAGIRGGFGESTRPITLSNAAQYATVPKDVNLVLNTPFAVLRTARTPIVEKVSYFPSDAEAQKVFSPIHIPNDTAVFEAKNVVVIILESFSKEFFGIYNRCLLYKSPSPRD